MNSMDFIGLFVHLTGGGGREILTILVSKLYIAPFYVCTFHQ
jgi:hypothetical protein